MSNLSLASIKTTIHRSLTHLFECKNASQRQGGIVPLVVILLIAVLAVGGLAVDYARIQVARAEIRVASDAAARSAATELVLTDSQSNARARAELIASRYKVGGKSFKLADSDILFGQRSVDRNGDFQFISGAFPPNAVHVRARRANGSVAGNLGLFFGPMFGVKSAQIGVGSTAAFRLVDICMVLDRSSSMKLPVSEKSNSISASDPRFQSAPSAFPDCRWMALDGAVKTFLKVLSQSPGEEHVGIVTFASDNNALGVFSSASSIDLSLTSDLTNASNKITQLSNKLWNGMTFIEAGVRDGIEVLTELPGHRTNAEKIMIVLTDGYQNQGSVMPAAADAAKLGIQIHTISLGDFADKNLMKQVAAAGSGEHAHATDQAALTAIFSGLATSFTSLVE